MTVARQRLGARDSVPVITIRRGVSALLGVAPQFAGSGALLPAPEGCVPSCSLPF